MRISKWSQPVLISFGYPNNLKLYGNNAAQPKMGSITDKNGVKWPYTIIESDADDPNIMTDDHNPSEESKKIIGDHINSRLEELQSLTDYPFHFSL
jgi:hypothetical protein